ncbi:uncharacterized protein LOC113375526 [Ctenocephalides felis]|uniref:uncharacterized protein LOC113375526 n=1 Tax=Ctenocephalides felis TaxID=7515 RepID=UPI000E6E1562|nr:uncharacterized protein LOC113375526 [Ctenocephalides felis]
MTKIRDYNVIYTDGSKLDQKVGCAIYLENLNIKLGYKLPDFASIFTAEIFAIKKAIELIQRHKIMKTVIFTDSKSSIETLQNLYNKTQTSDILFYEVWFDIIRLMRIEYTIKIIWIKAHSGIKGNEIADKLAKQATKNGSIMHVATYKDYVKRCKNRNFKEWQKVWIDPNETRGAYYRICNPTVGSRMWQESFKFEDRRTLVTLTRLRLNHGSFPSHLHRIGVAASNVCRCGKAVGSSEHLILECGLFEKNRQDMLNKLHECSCIEKPVNLVTILRSRPNKIK